ncbi:hypothetical protein SAMN06295937_100885 [Sphingopyxis flava]|uniref:Uncharacterized protein n=1 Tax=Sphingopyxis flava TaxID=1507287 RepID=A0A1T5C138_9SPHN|nr:hypothetical protein SAMN06295937_100885 [Sphingopyxis flava]
MRLFAPLVPPRRPSFGRRQAPHPQPPVLAGPDAEARRLIDRILRHAGKRERR